MDRVLAPLFARFSAPDDAGDYVATVMAEDAFACDVLDRIRAPTLVIAGAEDPFYSPDLFRATAAGITDATLVLLPDMGHAAGGGDFQQAVLRFLAGARP